MMWHDYVALIIGIFGVAIIVWGVIKDFIEFLHSEFRSFRDKIPVPLDDIRYDMGRYLLLGIEFFVAADVVHTVIEPTLEQVAILGGLVIIRTIISYFLTREMAHVEKHRKENAGGITG